MSRLNINHYTVAELPRSARAWNRYSMVLLSIYTTSQVGIDLSLWLLFYGSLKPQRWIRLSYILKVNQLSQVPSPRTGTSFSRRFKKFTKIESCCCLGWRYTSTQWSMLLYWQSIVSQNFSSCSCIDQVMWSWSPGLIFCHVEITYLTPHFRHDKYVHIINDAHRLYIVFISFSFEICIYIYWIKYMSF